MKIELNKYMENPPLVVEQSYTEDGDEVIRLYRQGGIPFEIIYDEWTELRTVMDIVAPGWHE